MEEFRFHFTLTSEIADCSKRIALEHAAQAFFSSALGSGPRVDRLVVFVEPAPGAPFRILREFPFGAAS
jgi:hypothetical protein